MSTPYTADKIEPLARKFSEMLICDLGRDTVRKVIEKNTEYKARGENDLCASHNFCDANMVMLAALEDLKIVTRPDGTFDEAKWFDDIGLGDQPALDLWGKAWTMAIDNQFWIDGRYWFDEE